MGSSLRGGDCLALLHLSAHVLYQTAVAQLSHLDAATEVLSLAQACATIAAALVPIGARETLPLAFADGRVLAESVASPGDLPPFDNSAVDGYALAHADLEGVTSLPVVGRIVAGAPADAALAPGTTVRIFTGARLPRGADTVFMQEDVAIHGDRAIFPTGLCRDANIRLRGEDLARDAVALPAGRRLRPQDLALAAALGIDTAAVTRRPRVALFSTGDEIVERGERAGLAQRFDSNRVMLAALLGRAGAAVTDLGILPDDRGAIAAALAAAEPDHDLIVTSGGVSVGEEDHVKAAVAARGDLALWRLAIKPGRPLAFGRVGAVPFVGLPGNPVAAFVTFARVLRPTLAVLSGETYRQESFSVLADFTHRKREGLREYVRVALGRDEAGALRARKHGMEGAAILTSLTQTAGLAELAEDVTEVRHGDVLPFLPYEGLL